MILSVLILGACSPSLTNQYDHRKMNVVDRGYDYAIDRDALQAGKTVATNENNPSNLTLADLLRRTPGVNVTGNDNNASVRISGISSFQGSNPLFVIDGQQAGNDFGHVYSLVNPNDVVAITALKGSDAAIYGVRGGFGVVVIRTKQ